MIKRLWIISIIIFAALAGLSILGFHAIQLHAEGLEGRRLGEFSGAAEQIRLDVKRKLDEFIRAEQRRPYTDYQYYYIPLAANDTSALVRSPLGDELEHGLAYGHFQIDPDGSVVAPFVEADRIDQAPPEVKQYLADVRLHLLGSLNGTVAAGDIRLRQASAQPMDPRAQSARELDTVGADAAPSLERGRKDAAVGKGDISLVGSRRGEYKIGPLEEQQQVQVFQQSREQVRSNVDNSLTRGGYSRQQPSGRSYLDEPVAARYDRDEYGYGMDSPVTAPRSRTQRLQNELPSAPVVPQSLPGAGDGADARQRSYVPDIEQQSLQVEAEQANPPSVPPQMQQAAPSVAPADLVQIRIEPFTSVVVPCEDPACVFGGRVFLIRHVRIEDRHLLQGFELNQSELVEQVRESAARLVRRGMGFEVGSRELAAAAHTAILDFGFGDLVLSLLELDPQWIGRQIGQLRTWYFAILTLVLLATTLALLSLWRNVHSQLRLARKKDDFISAVSHELRTPLTTIRMYTEMLEKDWVRGEDKRREYYGTMRQETERLSRLIENVLDFSRIQRGRKQYDFRLGDINEVVGEMADMMAPCAARAGFEIRKDLGDVPAFRFDADAVMQIVINLVDNAVKYSRSAAEKLIIVRTRLQGRHVIIEVEDHGPGIPRRQRTKVFDEFYRIGDESTRETTGTGLGLALVRRFAHAHGGFVEVLTAKPSGAILRVALTAESA